MAPPTPSNRFVALAHVVGLSAVVLLLFGLTALACTGLLAAIRGNSILEPESWTGGIICSLIGALFILSFHVRRESLSVPFVNREAFVEQVSAALTERGYEVKQPEANRLLGKPSFASLLFGGTVQVQLQENSARLSGPKISVEGLRNRLRMQSHLESNRRSLTDSGHQLRWGRLRSVQIQFRAPGEQNLNLAKELVQALTQIGGTVHCDIGIWAQNDAGMEEILVEKMIRDKLKRKGIAVTVHKKPVVPPLAAETHAVAV